MLRTTFNLTALLLTMALLGCKPTVISDTKAITGIDSDGKKKALAFLAVQNDPEINVPKSGMSDRAKKLIQMPFFALVECGPTASKDAQQVMRQWEHQSGAGNLFLNKSRRLFSFGSGDSLAVSDCEVVGDRLMAWPTFAMTFTRIAGMPRTKPTSEGELVAAKMSYSVAQAFFLAIRGPYYFDGRRGGGSDILPRLTQMANVYSGFDASRRDTLVNWFKVGDEYFNPCHERVSDLWYAKEWRGENYTCDRMISDQNVADYFIGGGRISYPDIKVALMTELAAMHNELYASPKNKEDSLWDALTTTSDWDSYNGPGSGAAKSLAAANILNLTGSDPLTLDDGTLSGGEFRLSNSFSLDDTGTYIDPLASLMTGVLIAPEQKSTTINFGDGLQSTRVQAPTLDDRMIVLSQDPASGPKINGQNISEAQYYRMLLQQTSQARTPAEYAQLQGNLSSLIDTTATNYSGAHRSGANAYTSENRRVYVSDFETRKAAFERGDISQSEFLGGNTTAWRTTGERNGDKVEKLEAGPGRLFDTYQVGGDQLAYKFTNPDGTRYMVEGGMNKAAEARGYAVPDAQLQDRLLVGASQNFTNYLDAATTATGDVTAARQQIQKPDFATVDGSTWWDRMGQYGTQVSTAANGMNALTQRNNYENTVSNYANNYFSQMRGNQQDTLGGQNLLMAGALARNNFASREAVLPSSQIQTEFQTAGANAMSGAVSDTWNTASTNITNFSNEYGGGIKGFSTGVGTKMGEWYNQGMQYMGIGGGGSSSPPAQQQQPAPQQPAPQRQPPASEPILVQSPSGGGGGSVDSAFALTGQEEDAASEGDEAKEQDEQQ